MGAFQLDRQSGVLSDDRGRWFDAAKRIWIPGDRPRQAEAVDLTGAVIWLQRESPHRLRVPIGVIGPNEASSRQRRVAEDIGARLARMGLAIVCGGRQGVMEAVCRGAAANGGLSVGLLPEVDASAANPYVTLAIATGIGEARNAIVARSAHCLIAVGGSYGTLSEVALGLRFGKPVFGIAGAATVEGVRHCAEVDEVIDQVAGVVLALPD